MQNILEQIGITKEELIDRIVDKALGMSADYSQRGEDSWDEIPFSKVVDAQITKAIGDLILKMSPVIERRVEEVLTAEADKVFLMPFQRRDRFGEAVGEPTTIKNIIADSAEKYWTTLVGSDGKTGPSYGDKKERAEFYAVKVMTEYYDKELVGVVREIAKELKSRIPKTIADEISKTVTSYLK